MKRLRIHSSSTSSCGTGAHTLWRLAACQQPLAASCLALPGNPKEVVRRRRPTVHAAVLKVDDLPKRSTSLPHTAPNQPQNGAQITADSEALGAYLPPPINSWHLDPVLMSGCEVHAAPLNVAVLLSGGVDSSLALQLLVAAGHRCIAFYLQIWFQEDFRNFWDACPWEEDLKYAQQVCDSLGVPLEVVPMTSAYWERVVAASVAEIRQGRTPNPDVLCNSRVKFGAFVDHIEERARRGDAGQAFDRVASGHYARVVRQDGALEDDNHANAVSMGPDGVHSVAVGANGNALAGHGRQHSSGGRGSSTVPGDAGIGRVAAAGVPSNGSLPSLAGSHHPVTPNGVTPSITLPHLTPSPSIPTDPSMPHVPATASGDGGGGGAYLCSTPDAVKDQTYFLAHLSQAQMARAMFPLGGLTKPQVRALAAAAGLATQSRKDSQGICFLGKVKFPEFVKEHLGEWQGLIVEEEEPQAEGGPVQAQGTSRPFSNDQQENSSRSSRQGSGHQQLQAAGGDLSATGQQGLHPKGGTARRTSKEQPSAGAGRGGMAPTAACFGGRRVLGVHSGYWFYTVGQRGGIKLPGGPWYVVRKDCELNIVYVSRRYYEPSRRRDAFTTGPFSWLSHVRPDPQAPLLCKVRHGPHAYRCQLRPLLTPQPNAPATQSTAAAANSHGSAPVVAGDSSAPASSHSRLVTSDPHSSSEGPGPGQEQEQGPPLSWDAGALVVLDGSDQGLAAGQYAVLYQHGQCLGAAQIEACVDVDRAYDGPDAVGCAGVLSSEGLVHSPTPEPTGGMPT